MSRIGKEKRDESPVIVGDRCLRCPGCKDEHGLHHDRIHIWNRSEVFHFSHQS